MTFIGRTVFLYFTFMCGMNLYAQNKNLNSFLSLAEKNSPLIKDLNNQQQALYLDSLIIRAGARPQISANAAGLYAPVLKGYGFDKVLTNGQALEALLSVNYELLNGKRTNNLLTGIKLQHDSVKYARQLSVYDLNKTITDQYLTVFSSQQQVDFNQELLSLLAKEEVLLKMLTRGNIYKQTEYLTFLVTFKQQELLLKQAMVQFKSDYATLNYLTGTSDTTTSRLEIPQLEMPAVTESGFFFRRFEIDSLKLLNQKRSFALAYQPKLGVYVNGGYNSSFLLQPYKNFGTSAGFTFSIPIYDGHQKKRQYEKLSLAANTSAAYKTFFKQQQEQQVLLIRQQINLIDGLFNQIEDQIRLSKGLMEADRKLLPAGDVKIADFILAINNYRSAQNLKNQTTLNRLKLINQLKYWNR